MIADYVLPGSIILLKFGLRITTDSETNSADTMRALTLFPVDVGFLSLSYGSAILYSSSSLAADPSTIKLILAVAFLAIVLLLPVIVISKKAERAFVLAKHGRATLFSVLGYLMAFAITAISIGIGGLFQ
jgi:hypothetical protein